MRTPYTQESVLSQFIEIHGTKYDYSLVVYNGMNTNVDIICPIHGIQPQTPRSHKVGGGCRKCGNKKMALNNTKSHTTIIKEFKEINNNLNDYDYTFVDYKHSDIKVKIKCNRCNEIFTQRPSAHLVGHGCSNCNLGKVYNIETYRNRETTLYYIQVDNLYKIGLTLETVKRRYRQDKEVNIEIIKEWVFEDGAEAFVLEKLILQEFEDYKYYGTPLLIGGNSELFSKDILSLITPLVQ